VAASDHLDHPIIGYNVIEELVKYPVDNCIPTESNNIISSMMASFPTVDSKNIMNVVNCVWLKL
jgi:hypothetical protein